MSGSGADISVLVNWTSVDDDLNCRPST